MNCSPFISPPARREFEFRPLQADRPPECVCTDQRWFWGLSSRVVGGRCVLARGGRAAAGQRRSGCLLLVLRICRRDVEQVSQPLQLVWTPRGNNRFGNIG